MQRLLLLALISILLSGCGDDGETAAERTPARVTPVPSSDAPVPTPTAGVHASPTAEPSAEAGAGDEEGIEVVVDVTISPEGRISVDPEFVPAFLPVRFAITNEAADELPLVVQGEEGQAELRADVAPGKTESLASPGFSSDEITLVSPPLGPDASVELEVRRGG
jgi:hypothetical protein